MRQQAQNSFHQGPLGMQVSNKAHLLAPFGIPPRDALATSPSTSRLTDFPPASLMLWMAGSNRRQEWPSRKDRGRCWTASHTTRGLTPGTTFAQTLRSGSTRRVWRGWEGVVTGLYVRNKSWHSHHFHQCYYLSYRCCHICSRVFEVEINLQ